MKKSHILLVSTFLLVLLLSWTTDVQAGKNSQSQDSPVVHVVMFWLSTCGHCEYVINEVLPPLQDQYGDQLEILLVELVTQEDVDTLYETANLAGIPPNNVGVPFMLVGEQVLQGSQEIPDQLPALIETHLAGGGLDYPSFPTLQGYLPEAVASPTAAEEETSSQVSGQPVNSPIPEEPAALSQPEAVKEQASNGFTIALVVLVGMVLAIIFVLYVLLKDREPGIPRRYAWLDWLIPVVALAGIGVAGYLTYIETNAVEAICGPIGDCNAVQNSIYSRVFGILPVGILGLAGYVAILVAWLVQEVRQDKWGSYARLAMLGMGLFGTLYSIYLTYLELWVIYAVCMWCVSSAVLVTILMLLSAQPAVEALDSLSEDE